MATSSLFIKTEMTNSNSITFTAKQGVEWDSINTFMEKVFGRDGKDKHIEWRGFGGSETGFKVVMIRKHCDKGICECEECETCGELACDLENDEGEGMYGNCCSHCREYEECEECGCDVPYGERNLRRDTHAVCEDCGDEVE